MCALTCAHAHLDIFWLRVYCTFTAACYEHRLAADCSIVPHRPGPPLTNRPSYVACIAAYGSRCLPKKPSLRVEGVREHWCYTRPLHLSIKMGNRPNVTNITTCRYQLINITSCTSRSSSPGPRRAAPAALLTPEYLQSFGIEHTTEAPNQSSADSCLWRPASMGTCVLRVGR